MTDAAPRPVVGLAGTGRMGAAMAHALARAGLPLVLHNRTPAPAEALAAELGARVAASPAALAAAADVVLTTLADDAAVVAVYRGPAGLLEGAHEGSVLVDLSTVMPATIVSLAEPARSVGAGLLDAPVSGSTSLAEAGQLTLMVGGDAADLERARPALEPLARTIFHLGPLGSGAAMKLAVNTVVFGLNGALAEGLVLAEAAGIPRPLAYDVLAASAVGAPLVGYKRNAFLDPAGTPVAFALDLAAKDLRLIRTLAASLGLELPQAATNLDLIRSASSGGRGGRDFSTVADALRTAPIWPGSGAAGTTRQEVPD
jgi:3-hydroxyisobutyrate dehydrogenase-like beta-hydroxyacid dehydrogenase